MMESINIYRLHKGLDICLPTQIQDILSNENTIDLPDFDYAADVKNADYKSFASQLNELLYKDPEYRYIIFMNTEYYIKYLQIYGTWNRIIG